MLFNSFQFLFFFPIVVILFFLLPHKYRWFHLLAASCYFYMAFIPVYILILFLTIIIDYYAGIMIEKSTGKKRKQYLTLSLISNISILVIFKYFNFFIGNMNALASFFHIHNSFPFLHIILPIGLSFHTFQAISYNIEIYRGNQKAEKHFGIYALYVMFFPQLVAGPIERPQNMLHQFHEKKYFSFENLKAGSEQILWGFFKKLVVGDTLAIYVNSIYSSYQVHTGITLVMATFAFVFQVYCDFSGYSDIAIGTARIMGYHLSTNFNLPLSSKSISELWRRWHISLSSWVNDYLYTPLAIRLRDFGKWGIVLASLISFSILGLWHGASWNFVIYGFINGIFISYEILTRKQRKKISAQTPSYIYKNLSILLTFCFFSFSLIFFRANTFDQSITIIKNIFVTKDFWDLRIQDTGVFSNMLFSLLVMLLWERYYFKNRTNKTMSTIQYGLSSIGFYIFFILMIVLFGVSNGNQFIYFQF
jgi:alginate O-acetyltransferase complex protein AlgI